MDPIEQWLRADSGAGKAAAGNRLVAEIERLREISKTAYMTWACGEPVDEDMKKLGKALRFK